MVLKPEKSWYRAFAFATSSQLFQTVVSAVTHFACSTHVDPLSLFTSEERACPTTFHQVCPATRQWRANYIGFKISDKNEIGSLVIFYDKLLYLVVHESLAIHLKEPSNFLTGLAADAAPPYRVQTSLFLASASIQTHPTISSS